MAVVLTLVNVPMALLANRNLLAIDSGQVEGEPPERLITLANVSNNMMHQFFSGLLQIAQWSKSRERVLRGHQTGCESREACNCLTFFACFKGWLKK